jgi:histone-lysine N-methyltransferase SETMAR
MLTDAHKMQRMPSALTFLDRYRKDGIQFLSHIVRVTGDETSVSIVNAESIEQSKQWIHTHSSNKPKRFKRTLTVCQKADGNCFLGGESCADGGIHASIDHSDVRSVLRNTKILRIKIQKKRLGMQTSGVVLLHEKARLHTSARTPAVLEHFNWELSDHNPRSLDLAPSDYHLFTYLKTWLRSQRFRNMIYWKVAKRG